MRKHLFLLLTWAVVLCALSVTAFAAGTERVELDLSEGSIVMEEVEGGIQYTQGDTVTVTTGGCFIKQTGTEAIANTLTVKSGEVDMLISGLNVEVSEGTPLDIQAGASVELTLYTTSYFKATGSGNGIHVPETAALTVKGSGTLYITASYDTGIGGNDDESCGTVTINGGAVTANGGSLGAGIGGGDGGDGGIITINDGTVNATGFYGAGIGGGYDGDGGIITINGGTVTATGGHDSAGIGGRYCIITINDGTVNATGGNGVGSSGSGIGGSQYGNGGTITITGGTVTATSDYSSGIGSGNSNSGGTVTITGGTVNATGGYYGAGIGGVKIDIRPEATVIANRYQEKITRVQPTNNYGLTDHIAPLSVSGSYGFSGLTYQWQVSADSGRTWSDVTGATTDTLSVSVNDETTANRYRCVLTNGWGNTATTNSAKVIEFVFKTQPTATTVNNGQSTVLSAETNCKDALYQWQRSVDGGVTWSDLEGKDTSSVMFSSVNLSDGGLYRCVATAPNGDELPSDSAQLTVTSNANTYMVKYYQEALDGDFALADRMVIEAEAGTPVTAEVKTYPGFTLDQEESVLSGTVEADSGLILKLFYTRDTETITFVSNGGSAVGAINAKHGATITAPAAPSRFGHTFDGWYSDEDLEMPYAFTTMPIGGMTLYAKWVPINSENREDDEYTINGVTLRDADSYEVLDSFPKEAFIVEVSVDNHKSLYADTVMIITYTQQGQYLGMQYAYSNTEVGGTLVFGMSIDNADGRVGKVTVMVLPALNNTLTPLAASVTVGGK